MQKRGQITLFIIIALILVAAILLMFLAKPQIVNLIEQKDEDPQDTMEKCARDAVEKAVDIMLPQGGVLNPTNYKMFENNRVQYLCYTNVYYNRCVNQQPMYIEFMEEEIKKYVQPIIEDCFFDFKKELEAEGNKVSMNQLVLDIELASDRVVVIMDRRITATKNDVVTDFDGFDSILKSPLYNLGIVATEIVNQEARYCNFQYIGFMAFYPRFEIKKKNVGSMETAAVIYTLEDSYTKKQLNIAVRSCVMPPGM
ncbi:MAG: hypothetical protein KKF56_01025 [Nanoarchaeota archaeon]|nr:hypothetical protein [Nanoarchaeota archaeon]